MKKTKRLHSKLNLLRKTVRRLDEKSLSGVGGGDTEQCGPTACCTLLPPCCTTLC